jgi:hypothetical protein
MPKKTLRTLTLNQQIALQRRAARRELSEALDEIARHLTKDDEPGAIPANYRARTAKALGIILHGGPVFALACAKAYLSRSYPLPHNDEIWSFIDEQNAQFAACVPSDIVARWNAPDYDLPGEGGQK